LHSYRFAAKFSASNANIQNRVRAAFDNTDGFHGGVDENRLLNVIPLVPVCRFYLLQLNI